MKHKGFVLIEALVCGGLMAVFFLFLLQFYGSALLTMNHANILHQGLNLAESVGANKMMTLEGYTVTQELGTYKNIKVKYHGKDLLNTYQAP